MMHVIVREGLHDADYVARYTIGFDALRERLAEYPPARAERITGIPRREIEELARAYATTRPSLIRLLVGLEYHAAGAMTYRTIACPAGAHRRLARPRRGAPAHGGACARSRSTSPPWEWRSWRIRACAPSTW
jgi:anaerobic selenocysteine-containing dehydrogenase